jgi:hypothetical protein
MTGRDDSQWQDMDVNEELDEQAADRLLAGELGPDEAVHGYGQVAALLAATRTEPSAAELARQAETVRAMVTARRAGGEGIGASAASGPTPLARRRSVRLGVVAAVTTLSLSTGLAAAGLLPGSLRSIASGALPSLTSSSPDSEGQGPGGEPPADPSSPPAPGAPDGAGAVPERSTRPPQAHAPGPQPAPQVPAGQAKQAAREVLRAEATTARGQLIVSFRETGVGADAVTVTARADANATYGCVAQRGNSERVRRDASVEGVSEAGSRFDATGGSAGGVLTLTAPSPVGVACRPGEVPQLLRVRYSRVVVLDVSTGASTTINRTFSTTV